MSSSTVKRPVRSHAPRVRKTSTLAPAAAPAVPYVRCFEGELEGYVMNHLKRDYWRVACSMEHDDCMQEARLIFLKLQAKYPDVEPKHFMALFKRTWHNEFNDFSTADTEHRKAHPYRAGRTARRAGDEQDKWQALGADQFMGETENGGVLRLMVQQAPREVRMVLALFLSAPAELLELVLKTWEDRRLKNRSEKVCAMLGLPPDMDVMQMTHDYFSK